MSEQKKKQEKKCKPNSDEFGCQISLKERRPCGGVIELSNGWLLNHYEGSEGFLGWLALQPCEHREQLYELEDHEMSALGGHIKGIERALRKYWQSFKDDSIERVYVVCFSEYSKHLHFHLIARTRKVGELALCTKACSQFKEVGGSTKAIAWNIPFATKCAEFPKQYKVAPRGQNDTQVDKLMKHLKDNLGGKWYCGEQK